MLEVTIDKLVHGGQGLATLPDGKKALLWNVLPGETVRFEPRKSKSSYVEGLAEEIIKSSAEREVPRDDLYLSTSPWQMMLYASENKYKQEILRETLVRGGVEFGSRIGFEAPDEPWHYRGKMEYSFYGDDDGLHLALFNRGTHQKQIVSGSSIARPEIDETAQKIRAVLEKNDIRAGDLKSVVVRCNQNGETVAAIYTKNEKFPDLPELENIARGVAICFSNPRSPASVMTRLLTTYGDITLSDKIVDTDISYDVFSFFQVNIPIFEVAVRSIVEAAAENSVIDFYGGTGAIGLSIPGTQVIVDSDTSSIGWARKNAVGHASAEAVLASAEKSLEYITADKAIVVDPPRAGLHKDVTARLLEVKPPKIIYLSCNPSTQARDLQLLQEKYVIKVITGYNFFPRTPHIESLAMLERRP